MKFKKNKSIAGQHYKENQVIYLRFDAADHLLQGDDALVPKDSEIEEAKQKVAQKQNEQEEREKRRKAFLWELLTVQEVSRKTQPVDSMHWKTDRTYFRHQVLSKETRGYLDDLLGPLPLAEIQPESDNKVAIAWSPFSEVYKSESFPQKKAIAEHLLTADDGDTQRSILPRHENVLLAPAGSTTVFQVALALAFKLRDSTDHTFDGQWHTDSLAVANLLSPLAVDENAPKIYLAGSVVSLNGLRDKNPIRVKVRPDGVNRSISTLILGCEHIEEDGSIYTGEQEFKQELIGYLDEPNFHIIVVATADKLSPRGDHSGGSKVDYDVTNSADKLRNMCIVTDSRPEIDRPPFGFEKVHWPACDDCASR